jgi:hypothetical protein
MQNSRACAGIFLLPSFAYLSYPLFYRLAFLFFHRLISTLGHCPNLISLHRLISPSHTITSASSFTAWSHVLTTQIFTFSHLLTVSPFAV